MLNKQFKKNNFEYDGWELSFFDKSKNFRNYQLNLIKNYLRNDLAEVGPGNGVNAHNYYKYPKKIDLYEPSKKLYLNLRRNFKKKKIKIFNKRFNSNTKYDTILYLDVIEHIKEDSKEIKKAFKAVKKNGYLVISVPAFQHLYSNFDRDIDHHKRYNKNDFKIILKKIKHKKVDLFYYDSIGYILSLLSKLCFSDYKTNFEKKLIFWDSLIWISRILDKIIFRLFGKSLLVIIKKTE